MKWLLARATIAFLILTSILMIAPVAAASSALTLAPLTLAKGKAIPNSYIVVLKQQKTVTSTLSAAGIKASHIYGAALNGFAATLNAGQLNALRSNPNVASIEQDQVATIDTTQTGAPWGLDRIDQHNLPLSGSYTYTSTGAGVTAYIIDTGIQTSHPDFGGRAAVAYDALGGSGQDCNGHGTHVAGTVGGATYGVAKGVTLRAVRVLDCYGSGSYAGVIAGVNWVTSYHAASSVANMSLGGSFSSALNSAVTNMVNAGVFTAVAAGNSAANACNSSPSSASGVLTVAASASNDSVASFSNWGGCVSVYAPGVNIPSDWIGSSTNTISGTSMASPHATGAGALYKASFGDTASATIVNWIINNATAGVLSGVPSGTPNRLLFMPVSASGSGFLSGTVWDTATGQPLSAVVSASGPATLSVTTNANGQYSMTLPSGTYTVTASKGNYNSQTVSGVVVNSGATTTQDFTLQNSSSGSGSGFLSGTVWDAGTGQPLSATVSASGPTTLSVVTNTSGQYSMNLPSGTYTVTVSKGRRYYSQTVSGVVVSNGATTTQDFWLEPSDYDPCPYC